MFAARMRVRYSDRWRQYGWKEFVFALVISTMAVCMWLFYELATRAPRGEFLEAENRLIRSLRHADDPNQLIGPPWLAEFARDITALGGGSVLTVLTLLILGFLLISRRPRTALLVLLATLGGWGLNAGLKEMFGRERPSVVPHLMIEHSASFPSGHSMISSIFYLTMGSILAQTMARRREKIYLIHAALLLAFAIGCSRVYLGVHYPTDVLAGWAGGTAWALLCWSVAFWLQERGTIKTPAPPDPNPETPASPVAASR